MGILGILPFQTEAGAGSLLQKFDDSGVSGSPGRGRSQALESKVRFADQPGVSKGKRVHQC